MEDRMYSINKGINKAIEFKGLKAQYIWWVAGIMLGALMFYAVLYVSGLSGYIGIPLTFGLAALLIRRVYLMSKRYGQYGMMKWSARRGVPRALVSNSRKGFILIRKAHGSKTK
jgi:hypothetical protein